MNSNVKTVLEEILERFKSGDIPQAVALASFPCFDVPSSRWSFTNRILMYLAGTEEARGFLQWQAISRWVKKGARAIHILVPCLKREIDEKTGEEIRILCYFKSAPVFRYKDTDGKPLEQPQLALPEFPFIERATEWGVSVKAIPGNLSFRGYYLPEQKGLLWWGLK
jgi:hypothetical protein